MIKAEELETLEAELIKSVIEAREECGLTQGQLSEICGVQQPLISRLENSVHPPTVRTINRVLRPLGYKLAVVKDEAIALRVESAPGS